MEFGTILEMDTNVFFQCMVQGHIGLMYHRDIGWSTLATFEHPERELFGRRVVEGAEKLTIEKELSAIEAAIRDNTCNFMVSYKDKIAMMPKEDHL